MTIVLFNESAADSSSVWAILALLVSIAALIFTIYWSFRSEKQGYADAFWFRTIVGPGCIKPIVDFREKWNSKLGELRSGVDLDVYKRVVGDLQRDRTSLENSLWISKIFGLEIYAECTSALDDLEDEFAEKLAALIISPACDRRVLQGLENKIVESSVRMLRIIAKKHSSGLKIED